jgi:hypothetical protein
MIGPASTFSDRDELLLDEPRPPPKAKLSSNAVALELFMGREMACWILFPSSYGARPEHQVCKRHSSAPLSRKSSFYSRERDLPTPFKNARTTNFSFLQH